MKRRAKNRSRNRLPRLGPGVKSLESPEDTGALQPGTGPRLSGGDVDADWRRADSAAEAYAAGERRLAGKTAA